MDDPVDALRSEISCDQCGDTFWTVDEFLAHRIFTEHSQRSPDQHPKPLYACPQAVTGVFICCLCRTAFAERSSAKAHRTGADGLTEDGHRGHWLKRPATRDGFADPFVVAASPWFERPDVNRVPVRRKHDVNAQQCATRAEHAPGPSRQAQSTPTFSTPWPTRRETDRGVQTADTAARETGDAVAGDSAVPDPQTPVVTGADATEPAPPDQATLADSF